MANNAEELRERVEMVPTSVKGYFDGTGSSDPKHGSRFLTLAGYVAETSVWAAFEKRPVRREAKGCTRTMRAVFTERTVPNAAGEKP